MPDIKLRDGSGVENTYEGVDTITLPLADGSGQQVYTYGNIIPQMQNMTNAMYFLSSKLMEYMVNTYSSKMSWGNITTQASGWQTDLYITADLSNWIMSFKNNSGEWTSDCKDMKLNCKKIPYITTMLQPNQNSAFNCYFTFPYTSDEEFYNKITIIPNSRYTYGGSDFRQGSLPSFENFCEEIKKLTKDYNGYAISITGFHPYYNLIYGAYNLKYADNIPVISSSITSGSTNRMDMNSLRSFTFETDNGTPKTANWKNATFKMGGTSNYEITGVLNSRNYIGSPNKKDDPTDFHYIYTEHIIEDEETYELYKNYEDAVVVGTSYTAKQTYTKPDGTVFLAQKAAPFSFYNHDRIVETLQSLPDVTMSGGNMTISFYKYSGTLTDEGGADSLTPAEIQVATDKGWTVTLFE